MDDFEEALTRSLHEGGSYADAATEVLDTLLAQNHELTESLDSVKNMLAFEDRGWEKWWGSFGDDVEGFSLTDIQEISETIREYMVGSPLIKRGILLRRSYVWSKGISIPGVEKTNQRGVQPLLRRFYLDPTNQDSIFSSNAHEELEGVAYSDGVALAFCSNIGGRKTVRIIPISQITDIRVNPDFPDEIWAYQRSWNRTLSNGSPKTISRWYYTYRFSGTKQKTITTNGKAVEVDPDTIVVDKRFNGQVGWPLGIPDALPVIAWAKLYSEFLKYGKVMSEALAKFAFKVVSKTSAGAANAAAKVGGSTGSGRTASLVEGQDIVPLNSAGRGYDFNSGRPLAAMVATGIEVSIVHLLSDPGAAGSSYGAASNLDLPTKRAMVSRQEAWKSFFSDILFWAVGENLTITFPEIDDPDPYRELQRVALGWGMGALWADELRPKVLSELDIEPLHDDAPDGILIPNNEKSLARKDIDTDQPGGKPGNGSGFSNAQGSNSQFAGAGPNTNDLRRDVLANSLAGMGQDELNQKLNILIEAIQRIEASKA